MGFREGKVWKSIAWYRPNAVCNSTLNDNITALMMMAKMTDISCIYLRYIRRCSRFVGYWQWCRSLLHV